jgi:hypothetical protein
MNRASAFSYLEDQFKELADNADFSQDDVSHAYSIVIDQSLRALGVVGTDLGTHDVGDSLVVAYCALLDYYALERYMRAFSMSTQVTISRSLQVMRQQVFGHVTELHRQASHKLILLGVGPVELMQPVRYNLDFLEPDLTMTGEV